MRVWLNVTLALGLAGPALAAPVEGVWRGSYVCAQGSTALELFVTHAEGGQAAAFFHFGDGSVSRPEGCFAMAGSLDHGTLALTATRWIRRPNGYVTVNLIGPLSEGSYAGLVLGPGCTTFQLGWSPLAPLPDICRETPGLVS